MSYYVGYNPLVNEKPTGALFGDFLPRIPPNRLSPSLSLRCGGTVVVVYKSVDEIPEFKLQIVPTSGQSEP